MNAKFKRVIQAISPLEITFAKHERMLPPNGVLALLFSAATYSKEYHKQFILHPSTTHLQKQWIQNFLQHPSNPSNCSIGSIAC